MILKKTYIKHLFTMLRVVNDKFNQFRWLSVLQFRFETIFSFTIRYDLSFHSLIVVKHCNTFTWNMDRQFRKYKFFVIYSKWQTCRKVAVYCKSVTIQEDIVFSWYIVSSLIVVKASAIIKAAEITEDIFYKTCASIDVIVSSHINSSCKIVSATVNPWKKQSMYLDLSLFLYVWIKQKVYLPLASTRRRLSTLFFSSWISVHCPQTSSVISSTALPWVSIFVCKLVIVSDTGNQFDKYLQLEYHCRNVHSLLIFEACKWFISSFIVLTMPFVTFKSFSKFRTWLETK